MVNYLFSLIYFSSYYDYKEAKKMVAELDGVNCEVPGMSIIMAYSSLVVLTTGTFCFLVYLAAFTYRIINIIFLQICPLSVSNMRRSWSGIPNSDFSHYEKEFDFEVNLDEQPDYWNATGPEKWHS